MVPIPSDCPPEEGCKYSKEAAKVAVKDVFAILGVDVDDPKEVEEFRKDLRFGQTMRKAAERGTLALVCAAFVSAGAFLWYGIASKLGGH